MPSINDWAAKAAKKIHMERYSSVERKAAIITVHAEPLLKLLKEASNGFHQQYCPLFNVVDGDDTLCDCGAVEWHTRVQSAMNGR